MPAPHTPEELIDRYKAKQPAPNSPTTPVEQLSFASEAVSLGYALEDVYSTLEGKADTTALAGLVDTTDSRLSDPRAPLAHAHAIVDVTGLQTALDAKATPATVSTAIGALAAVAASGAYADLTDKPTIPTQYTDAQAVSANASAISTASTSDRARANHTGTQAATTITGLASVATSGSYADLSNKPTIPSAYTDAQAVSANASAIATASTADRNTDNHVSGTTNKVYTATEQSKLSGIATGATNYTDAKALLAVSAGGIKNPGVPAPDMSAIEFWGDSHVAGAGQTPITTSLSTLSGLTVNNRGVGGYTSTQVKAAFDASSTAQKNRPNVFQCGFNDYPDLTTVKTNIAAMVAALSHDSYLVIGDVMSANGGFESGATGWLARKAFNDYLALTYGDRYFDVHAFIMRLYNPASAQDCADYVNDIEPTSTRIDTQHFTSATNNLIGAEIYRRLGRLTYTSTLSATPTGIAATAANALPIGTKLRDKGVFDYVFADKISLSLNGAIEQEGVPVLVNNLTRRDTFIGQSAGVSSRGSLTVRTANVFIGYQSGASATGVQDQSTVGIGYNALFNTAGGQRNVAVGAVALFTNTAGSNNTAVGSTALINSTGFSNTAIGQAAGPTITSAGLCIIIGSGVDVPSATTNGQINIGNLFYGTGATGQGTTAAGNAGIGVAATTARVTVPASTTAAASLNMPHGAAPTTPQNGDMWSTTAGLFIRINGVTKTVTLT